MLILSITDILISWGYWGMGIASFLAGSFIPFSSEAILSALYLAGFNLWWLVIYATIGNVLGGMFNYFMGRLCKEKTIYKIFRVKPDKLAKSRERVQKYGAWMGLLSWVPILGSCITIAMGTLHIGITKSVVSISLGKIIRYIALGYLLMNL